MIVYSRFNTHRLPKFRLNTTIELRDNKYFVRKRAATPAAEPFLHALVTTSKALTSQNLPFEICAAASEADGSVVFPLAEGNSFDYELRQLIIKRDRQGLLRAIKQYAEILRGLPQRTIIPGDDFRAVFGNSLKAAVPCNLTGCLDLNFDNIFVSGSRRILIDYEWSFQFEIPLDFILFRAVTAFYGNHLHRSPNSVIPIAELFKELGIGDSELAVFAQLELSFERYVYGDDVVKQRLQGNSLQERYAMLAIDPGINNPADRLSKHGAFVSYLESEDAAKQRWILKIEEIIAAKDDWIRRLEQENNALRSEISRLNDSLRGMSAKHLSLLTAEDYANQFEPFKERLSLLESEINSKNSLISKLECQVADKEEWFSRIQSDMEAIFTVVKQLSRSPAGKTKQAI